MSVQGRLLDSQIPTMKIIYPWIFQNW